MTREQLKEKIDRLGELREQLGSLSAAERDLSADVREGLEEDALSELAAETFAAQLAERRSLRLDTRKFRRKVGDELFLACARVDLKAARQHFSDEQLERLGKVAVSVELRVSRRAEIAELGNRH
jgi:regulator of replication initiation timing